MRGRSNSAPPGPHTRSTVTVKTAPNDNNPQQTRTITASQVRGFTQENPSQRPTVYLRDQHTGQAQGRVTQEHGVKQNIGAHQQRGQEAFFGNVSGANIQQVDRRARQVFNMMAVTAQQHAENAGTAEDGRAAHAAFMQQPKLVEIGINPGTAHISRAPFQDATTNPDLRDKLMKSLKQGPLNSNPQQNLAQTRRADGSYSGSKDDWHK